MISILYEDVDIIVVNKCANMPSQKDFSRTPDVLSWVNQHVKQECYLIHRLDRHVAGPMVFAKTKVAAKNLNEQVSVKQDVDGYAQDGFYKEYLAVVLCQNKDNISNASDIRLTHYQKKDKNLAITLDSIGYEKLPRHIQSEYKMACLAYSAIAERTVENECLLLLKIHLFTGRYHQIRSQLAYVGLPILGDPKYGTMSLGNMIVSKIGLQAASLGFLHPKTKRKLLFTAKHADEPFSLFPL